MKTRLAGHVYVTRSVCKAGPESCWRSRVQFREVKNMIERLKEYAKVIRGEIIAEGMDKETLEIPILIVKTN